MVLVLWAVVCVAMGWDAHSVVVSGAMFFGGVIGCEIGLKAGEIVANRLCQFL